MFANYLSARIVHLFFFLYILIRYLSYYPRESIPLHSIVALTSGTAISLNVLYASMKHFLICCCNCSQFNCKLWLFLVAYHKLTTQNISSLMKNKGIDIQFINLCTDKLQVVSLVTLKLILINMFKKQQYVTYFKYFCAHFVKKIYNLCGNIKKQFSVLFLNFNGLVVFQIVSHFFFK